MPSIGKYGSGESTGFSPSSSRESKGRHSSVIDAVAFSSQSTAPTSLSGSPRLPESKPVPSSPPPIYYEPGEDLSPSTMCYPRASVDTYVSGADSEEELDRQQQHQLPESALDLTDDDDVSQDHHWGHRLDRSADSIPPLPEYRHDIVDRNVCPATPQEFAQLFPSLDRMSVRHDEFTTDGNMNLRVDVSVPMGRRRIPTSYQLFHLRMYDLAKREFSLRRYSRDSGREVCNSKRTFIDPSEKKQKHKVGRISRKSSDEANLKHWGQSSTSTTSNSNNNSSSSNSNGSADIRPGLQRSMTTALRSLSAMATKPSFRRSNSSGSNYHEQRPATSHSPYGNHHNNEYTTSSSRPSLSSSTPSLFGRDKNRSAHFPPPPKPTNTIKLEFSNYARVDLEMRGGHNNGHDNTRYEFTWWDHKYTWKRAVEKHLNVVSYHLLRDDKRENPVAHIVPEMRSPNQVDADEEAGGWIPPCHMWIADPSVLEAMTDVADIIVSTGLIALADDCIRTRWQPRKAHGIAVPLISRTLDMDVNPRALMQHVFHRRNSSGSNSNSHGSPYTSSPLRHA